MIDAHLHLQYCLDPNSPGEVLNQLRFLGVKLLMVNGTSPEDWGHVRKLAKEIPEVIPSFGLHPWKVDEVSSDWESLLRDLLERHPNACVGEVGLDRWMKGHDLPKQTDIFLRQLALASEWKRPASVHCLRAWGRLLDCIDDSCFDQAFLLHSYGGPSEMVEPWVNRGAYFSISGYFFRKDKTEKLKVFETVPEDRILLETDAPDMPFGDDYVRYRHAGIQNHPANIEVVYERFAEWLGKPLEAVTAQVEANFYQFLRSTPKPLEKV